MSQPQLQPEEAPSARVEQFCHLDAYQGSRGHLFPSIESLRWFVRVNRQNLVQAGALLMIAGRWMVDPARFDAEVVRVGQRAAGRVAR